MSRSILVVDDDIDIQVQFQAILEEKGFTPRIASNVREAWDTLENQAVDLILLDVMMEKSSDGFNLAQKLKGSEKYKSIPIIMITSVNQKMPFNFGPGTDGDFLPVETFMEKPIDPEALVREIQRLL
jgi:CheY-like chemotaxis protein